MICPRVHLLPGNRCLARALIVPTAMLAFAACERSVAIVPALPQVSVDANESSAIAVPADSELRYPFVPDPARTPGAALDVAAADICVRGYSRRVRNVPVEIKREAYTTYGVRSREPGEYEIDHLISLELGGSNSLKNLWPQSFRTHPWNAYVKDALENELHRRVCAGTIDLAKAQDVITHNWVIGYRIYVRQNPPAANARGKRRTRQRRGRPRTYEQPQAPVP